ncbi:Re/Si-specific NAD(P)(+) transhydrogenase subunit alpha [Flavihumibacter profundi]|jgi:H+-translocating NAD(P) transhydrogenase subunit alpha|uniref:Re/Si-specific NAD(P)(+) transhydrogenase subunit alpha n=1 Tax=Flavihumibacter profundi TaxID=2716883 RepID=UPI001CC36B9F|nr:Re/Si-specific NAD(P)(+) transhydrogenase subunit alpha [Flavihumibacter profundi]MBZ5857047.1 Re/Si-specific NAD(P)(+) transhydrogenase subunit alpha [Flavihumibacter profundi]
MIIGVLKEPPFETRVSLLPEAVTVLIKKGHQLLVEKGAGEAAFATDEHYRTAGAGVVSREEVFAADAILSIHPPTDAIEAMRPGSILIGVFQPLYRSVMMQEWANAGITCFSLDMLPRTTRAQSMDVLSSQANISGYKAVLLAAFTYSRYFPMFMTAAGSIAPARVLILGAGVAGLQAIATARRLGAVVEVFDTRPAVKEEVMSLGAKFVEVEGAADASKAGGYAVEQDDVFKQRQQQRIADSIAKADIVITTAQIPGLPAPVLVSAAMIESMRTGSVIIDLAAATGGNTTLTKNDATVLHQGVTIVGNSNLPATMPSDASKLYGKNLVSFLQLLTGKEAQLFLNWDDDLVKGCCILTDKKIIHERVKAMIS